MQKMDINFRNVLSTKDHGCLKHIKMKLVEKRDQWETVLLNIKHVLRSVLKALDYMHEQGLVHRDVKGERTAYLNQHFIQILPRIFYHVVWDSINQLKSDTMWLKC